MGASTPAGLHPHPIPPCPNAFAPLNRLSCATTPYPCSLICIDPLLLLGFHSWDALLRGLSQGHAGIPSGMFYSQGLDPDHPVQSLS